jgi:hypothetical protein
MGFAGAGQVEEAVALDLRSEDAEAHLRLGRELQDQGRIEEALAWYERALAFRPDFADAHVAKAMNLLLRGHYAEGWQSYEWRWRMETFSSPKRNFPQPQWRGEALRGRRILLHGEQGFGDCLQFLRYVPMVQAAGGVVVLEIQGRLMRMCALLPGVTELFAYGQPLPAVDCHCPLLSLPLAFGTALESIPAKVPYLSIPSEARERARRIAWPVDGLRVGLVWAGSANHLKDKVRSLGLAMFEPLLALEGVHFFSLQLGEAANQRSAEDSRISDLGLMTRDMADTAAQIEQLDLVLSVDTSVAHLAGALGKPLWVLLSDVADWRWLRSREDSPWYPTARLFRQKERGNWGEVLERVGAELVPLAEERRQQGIARGD